MFYPNHIDAEYYLLPFVTKGYSLSTPLRDLALIAIWLLTYQHLQHLC